MSITATLSHTIREEALRIGFLDCGFSKVRTLTEHQQHYNDWLKRGHHAGMDYMARNIYKRFNPALLVDGAKTVISLLYNYHTNETLTASPLKIAKYAYGEDYHYVIKHKLARLDKFMRHLTENINQRSFVDSAPILERSWANNSGLGWIGKNSCLISRKHGSFFFIAEIITSLELEYDQPSVKDYCGSCRKCTNACPTQAITENRTVNSNRCISYQTIENRGEIPNDLKGKFQHYIFGCDICQDVCPWNSKASQHSEPLFQLNADIKKMTLSDWKNIDEEFFQKKFRKLPITRATFTGLKRNIDVVA
jgi:epoxyqueuosine reductase